LIIVEELISFDNLTAFDTYIYARTDYFRLCNFSAWRTEAFASIFRFGHFSLGDAEELSLTTKALTSFIA